MKTYSRNVKSPCSLREQSDNKYEDYCRLCLTKDNIMIHIFNEDEIVPIPLKLKYTTALEVSEDDGLPCGICTDCISKLDESYAFKKRCLATDSKLRQYIQLQFSNNFNSTESCSKVATLTESSNDHRSKDACTIKLEDNGLFFLNEFCNTVSKISNGNTNISATNIDLSNMSIESDGIHSFNTDLDNGTIHINNNYCGDENERGKDAAIEELQGDLNIDHNLVESSQPEMMCTRKRSQILMQTKTSGNENDLKSDQEDEEEDDDEFVNSDSSNRKVEKPSYKCSPCNATFANYKYLHDHKHAQHADSIKMCSFCTKTFISNSTLERHLRTHTGERPYNCEQCGKRFTQKEILARHVLTHTHINLTCSQCKYTCSSEETLLRHEKLRHTDSDPPNFAKYQCRKCDKAFCHPSGLSRHQAVHAGVLYRCVSCVKSFSDKSSVKRHFLKFHPSQKNVVKYYNLTTFQY